MDSSHLNSLQQSKPLYGAAAYRITVNHGIRSAQGDQPQTV